MLKECAYCGKEFETDNPRKMYCCAEHRRAADNERKRDRRAEAAELRAELDMPDVWARNDLGEDVIGNALTDGWTAECAMCADEAIAGPLACQKCHHWQANQKSRKKGASIDLLCAMCRDGVRV